MRPGNRANRGPVVALTAVLSYFLGAYFELPMELVRTVAAAVMQ